MGNFERLFPIKDILVKQEIQSYLEQAEKIHGFWNAYKQDMW